MFDYFVLGYYMASEALTTGELSALLKRQISWNRLLTPVAMDLTTLAPDAKAGAVPELAFVELFIQDVQAGKWKFSVRSRGVKAIYKLKRGMRGFALAQGDVVIGDVWCVLPRDGKPASHPDLAPLGLTCGDREVYAFDMLIDPSYRGKNLAAPLQKALQQALKKEGFLKVYGAYYDDNIPALWMHRMLRFKEYPKRIVSRFFFFTKSEPFDPAKHSVKSANTTKKGD